MGYRILEEDIWEHDATLDLGEDGKHFFQFDGDEATLADAVNYFKKHEPQKYKALANRLELELLRKIFRHINPDKFTDSYFICGEGGSKSPDGLPELILICPAMGLDRSYAYRRVKIEN